MIGELSNAHPTIKAFTELIRAQGGPGMGFTVAWLYWYAWVVTIALEAVAAAVILQSWIPIPIGSLSVGLILAITGVNLLSTRSFGEFEFWLSSIKIVAILVFIVAAVGFSLGIWGGQQPAWSNLLDHGGFIPRGPTSVLAGVMVVFFSMCGAEVSTIASVEARENQFSGTRMAATLMVRLTLFYVAAIFLVVVVVPWTSIVPGVSPFITAFEQMGLPHAGTVMALTILTAILSNLNTAFYVSSRVLHTLAEHGEAPAQLRFLNARLVPNRAVLVGCASGLACLAVSFTSARSAFVFLVNGIGALALFVYLVVVITHLQFRRHRPQIPGERRVGLAIWVDYVVIFGIGSLLIFMAGSSGLLSPLTLGSVPLATVIGAYFLVRRRRRLDLTAARLADYTDAI
jgi:L-asparagine transporter-like permease